MGDYKQLFEQKFKKQTGIRQRGESWANKNVLTPSSGSQGQTVCFFSLSPSCSQYIK